MTVKMADCLTGKMALMRVRSAGGRMSVRGGAQRAVLMAVYSVRKMVK